MNWNQLKINVSFGAQNSEDAVIKQKLNQIPRAVFSITKKFRLTESVNDEIFPTAFQQLGIHELQGKYTLLVFR